MSKMKVFVLSVIIGFCFESGRAQHNHDDHKMAVCKFKGSVHGTVKIHHMNDNMKNIHFMGKLMNIPAGDHGFHVHEFGELGNKCKDAGSHYNPTNSKHGSLYSEIRHAGDLGNIIATNDNSTILNITYKNVKLSDYIGKSLVVHANRDDLGKTNAEDSQTTGNAGARLDCCRIEWEMNGSPSWGAGSLVVLLGCLIASLQ